VLRRADHLHSRKLDESRVELQRVDQGGSTLLAGRKMTPEQRGALWLELSCDEVREIIARRAHGLLPRVEVKSL
jgi:hypothetical protein